MILEFWLLLLVFTGSPEPGGFVYPDRLTCAKMEAMAADDPDVMGYDPCRHVVIVPKPEKT